MAVEQLQRYSQAFATNPMLGAANPPDPANFKALPSSDVMEVSYHMGNPHRLSLSTRQRISSESVVCHAKSRCNTLKHLNSGHQWDQLFCPLNGGVRKSGAAKFTCKVHLPDKLASLNVMIVRTYL